MLPHRTLPALLAGALLGACSAAQAGDPLHAAATLADAGGAIIGEAQLTQGPQLLLIRLSVRGLAPGAHGLHLHAVGACNAETGFKSAGGHHHEGSGRQHGLLNPQGPEAGDLPNLIVQETGTGAAEITTTLTSLASLLDSDGATLVIHAQADDHLSQPIGNAGARIACGVIRPVER